MNYFSLNCFKKGILTSQGNDRGKRFDYLLKQTEIFAHFMITNEKKDGSGSAGGSGNTPKKSKGRPRKPKAEGGDSAE